MKKNNYIKNLEILKLPKSIRLGWNTRRGVPRNHVYKVIIGKYTYFKAHFKRGGISFIKYFKLKRKANKYVDEIRALTFIK